jgi:hypothetical protein
VIVAIICASSSRDVAGRVLLMDEFDKTRLELLAKLAEQLASLQRECSEQ